MTTLSIEQDVIVAEIHGLPTEALLPACHRRLARLIRKSGHHRVLYDARHMKPPAVDVALAQRKLDEQCAGQLRRAVVVPNTRLGHLAGLAFGHGDYRIFYDDMRAAIAWLRQLA